MFTGLIVMGVGVLMLCSMVYLGHLLVAVSTDPLTVGPYQSGWQPTEPQSSATALLAGTSGVEYDDGVLPYRPGEHSLRNYVHRLLRDYRDRQ